LPIVNNQQNNLMKVTKLIYLFLVMISLAGCSPEGNSIQSITLTLSNDKIEIGESVTFSVTAENGQNLSAKAKYFVNGTQISGRDLTPDVPGIYSIKATYNNVTSNVVNLEVEALGTRFQKRPVLEDYTGTWCGWCPRVAYAIELLEDATDFAIPIAIHRGDTMETTYAKKLLSAFNVEGFPTAFVDRDFKMSAPEPNNVTQITDLTKEDAVAGLYFKSSLSGNTIKLKVKAQFGKDFDKDVKLVVVILEDGIKEDQKNYTSYFNGDAVLVDFVHNHVLRYAITPVLGDAIPASETKKNNIYTKEYSLTVPEIITDTNKMSFVAILVDHNKKVINARSVKVNETEEFEIK